MEFMTIIYLFFIFVSLYITLLFLLLYVKNYNKLFRDNVATILPTVSIIIPAFNAEKTIKETLRSVTNLTYPKDKLEILLVDDASTDNTVKIAKSFKHVKIIYRKENSGRAAVPINQGISAAKGELVAIVNADSYPQEDCLLKMVRYFKDEKVGGVTSCILVKNKHKLLCRLQSIEYVIIAWARKLMQYIDGVFVTPGALSIYRRKLLLKIGKLDENNWTEDIEIAWRLLYHGYLLKMCLSAKVYVSTPEKFRSWWHQRIRWDAGGLQTLHKYRSVIFKQKYKMLAFFVSPLFLSFFILSLVGFGVFVYLISRGLIFSALIAKNSYLTNTNPLMLAGAYLTPTVFTFFGIILFAIMLAYTILGLNMIKEHKLKSRVFCFDILVYLLVYLTLYPIVLIHTIYKLANGKITW